MSILDIDMGMDFLVAKSNLDDGALYEVLYMMFTYVIDLANDKNLEVL